MKAEFPQSSKQIHDLIAHAERSWKFVWTAGRILIKAGLQAELKELSYERRKYLLERLTGFLEELASQGILLRRAQLQSIGYGNEIGFDYAAVSDRELVAARPPAEP